MREFPRYIYEELAQKPEILYIMNHISPIDYLPGIYNSDYIRKSYIDIEALIHYIDTQ